LKELGPRLSIGFSIPTDDDTVRQIVEPKAPPIPTRWAAVERLAQAGLRVTVAATPLMAMTDPAGFARRGRESGIRGFWVGALRLLKNDAFYDVLARHRWLKVLDPDYQEEIRTLLQDALPPGRREGRRVPAKPSARVLPLRPACLQPTHPGLFE
jgi:DNA repair photolyase